MGFFDVLTKNVTHKVCVEVFKGKLEKAAIVDSSKKEFAENENLEEAVFIVEGAGEKIMTMVKDKLTFEANLADDFKMSYQVFFTKEKKILKIVAIINEGLDENLYKLMNENHYILRIQR